MSVIYKLLDSVHNNYNFWEVKEGEETEKKMVHVDELDGKLKN